MQREPALIATIADYVTGLRFEDIDDRAINIAAWLVFDTIGTALGGYARPLGRRIASYAAAGGPSTILGDGRSASTLDAAFVNASLAKILGMDDSHRQAGHIAAAVVPAVLATGQACHTSGREALTAIVAAYDFAIRAGSALRTEQRRRGQDLKGVIGPLASAAAAGRCAGLGAAELANAVALAVDMAGGTEQYVYEAGNCDTKDLIAGFAARSGVWAVELARKGFRGARGALDGSYGFFRAFGDCEPPSFADLGRNFLITATAFKPHGGCRHTHQAVDAVQQILGRETLDVAQIERVEVHTYRYALEPSFRIDPDPPGRDVAGLSIRVATAIALARGSAWPDDFEHWDDPAERRLRRAIDVVVEPSIERDYPERNGCRVVVRLRNGRSLEGTVEYAKGEPEWPMTVGELRAKFDALAAGTPAIGRTTELYERCMQLVDGGSIASVLFWNDE